MTTLTVPDPQALADGRADGVLPLYIAGRWEAAAGGGTYESYEPATGKVWARSRPPGRGRRPRGAGRPCRHGRPWGSTLAMDRARVLWRIAEIIDRNRDLLGRVESRDNGKLLRETHGELDAIVRYFEYFGGVCQTVSARRARPPGRSSPTPAASPWAWSARSSRGTRRCTCWRGRSRPRWPAATWWCSSRPTRRRVSALVLAVLLEEARLPPGVFNILPGHRP